MPRRPNRGISSISLLVLTSRTTAEDLRNCYDLVRSCGECWDLMPIYLVGQTGEYSFRGLGKCIDRLY